jgi:hypothetical protein
MSKVSRTGGAGSCSRRAGPRVDGGPGGRTTVGASTINSSTPSTSSATRTCSGGAASCSKWPDAAAVPFPRALQALLHRGLATRDRYQEGKISADGLSVAAGRLTAQLSRLVDGQFTHDGNCRLANFVANHLHEVFAYWGIRVRTQPTSAARRPSAPRSSTAESGAATARGSVPAPNQSSLRSSAPD